MRIDIKNWIDIEKSIIKGDLDGLSKGTDKPHLLIIQVGNNKESNSYITGKWKDCEDVGMDVTLFKVSPQKAFKKIQNFLSGSMHFYDGIILQEPSGLTENEKELFLKMIGKYKDVDGFRPDSNHLPCTPKGIMLILNKFYKNPRGVVTVVGRGELVGKPLIPLLVKDGWTVLCANSRTPDLKALTSMSDVVISATGCRNLITRDMLKDGAFVIDAGITFDENGKLCGDCDKSMYDDDTIQITTVPGGVGLTTRYALLKNTYNNWLRELHGENV